MINDKNNLKIVVSGAAILLLLKCVFYFYFLIYFICVLAFLLTSLKKPTHKSKLLFNASCAVYCVMLILKTIIKLQYSF